GAEAGGEAHGDRHHRRADLAHGVVDRKAGIDHTTRRVDVHLDLFVGIFPVEVQQLGHDQVGDLIVDPGAQKHDAFLEQQGVDIVGTFPAPAGFNDHRDQTIIQVHLQTPLLSAMSVCSSTASGSAALASAVSTTSSAVASVSSAAPAGPASGSVSGSGWSGPTGGFSPLAIATSRPSTRSDTSWFEMLLRLWSVARYCRNRLASSPPHIWLMRSISASTSSVVTPSSSRRTNSPRPSARSARQMARSRYSLRRSSSVRPAIVRYSFSGRPCWRMFWSISSSKSSR